MQIQWKTSMWIRSLQHEFSTRGIASFQLHGTRKPTQNLHSNEILLRKSFIIHENQAKHHQIPWILVNQTQLCQVHVHLKSRQPINFIIHCQAQFASLRQNLQVSLNHPKRTNINQHFHNFWQIWTVQGIKQNTVRQIGTKTLQHTRVNQKELKISRHL